MSSADRSQLELCRISDALRTARIRRQVQRGDIKKAEFWDAIWGQGVPIWFHLLEAYCEFHPSGAYVDLLEHTDQCGAEVPIVFSLRSELEKYFDESETFSTNVLTFTNIEV